MEKSMKELSMKTNQVPKKKISGLTEQQKNMISGYLYISPFFIIFFIIGLYPALFNFYLAFQEWNGFGEMAFVGLSNFLTVIKDPLFWKSIYNTIMIGVMSSAPQLIIGIVLASLLNLSSIRFKNFFRVTIFMPYITSMVAVALIFSVFFSNNATSLANYTISLFGMDPINWKTSEWGAKFAVALMIFWRYIGYNTIIYLAGLQSIPSQLYEAASIDGWNSFQKFRHITIPLLKPYITLVAFTSTVGALQNFTEPRVFLGNMAFSRDEIMTIVMYLYRDAFNLQSFGTASATVVLLLLLIILLTALNTFLVSGRLGKRRGNYDEE